jgi:3-oxoacyl-[acyl-carrier-protein] synthase-3
LRTAALAESGASLADVDLVCGIHMKRSPHRTMLSVLGRSEAETVYLEDTGHMRAVDPLLALDRASREGRVQERDLVLLIAAGTGYTWAAACVRWGDTVG